MPYQVNDKTGEMIPVRDLPTEIFQDLDRLDEEQIVAELKGGVIEEYVYAFNQGGQQVVGLSWVGAREASRHYGGLHIGEPKVQESEESWRILVMARDRVRDLELWGAAEQPKKMRRKDGSLIPDPFAFNKALSKAQRNALVSVLPTSVIIKTIQAYVESRSGVRQIESHANGEHPPEQLRKPPAQQPPIVQQPRTIVAPPANTPPAETATPRPPPRAEMDRRYRALVDRADGLMVAADPLSNAWSDEELAEKGRQLLARVKAREGELAATAGAR